MPHAPQAPHALRELGCTVDDLARWMPNVAEGRALERVARTQWRLALAPAGASAGPDRSDASGTPSVLVDAEPAADRVIALLRLPVLHVRFRFAGVDEAAQRHFMERFDLHTRRGGG